MDMISISCMIFLQRTAVEKYKWANLKGAQGRLYVVPTVNGGATKKTGYLQWGHIPKGIGCL